MGTGIAAGIPIVLGPYSSGWQQEIEKKYFSDKFFEHYTTDEDGKTYTIKTEFLLCNYKSFLEEFYELIGEELGKACNLSDIPIANTLDEFVSVFSGEVRNMQAPFFCTHDLSILGGECHECWLFYSGSYKAYLETYQTLLHFERILVKAMQNPLRNCVKFGIFG